MLSFPQAIAYTLATVAFAALSRMLAREWRRLTEELRVTEERDAGERAAAAVRTRDLPTLRLDPATGEYRPQ